MPIVLSQGWLLAMLIGAINGALVAYVRIQPIVATLKAVSQLLVIESEQMQDGGVQIWHGNRIFDGVIAKFIGCAVDHSTFHSSAG